MLNHHQIADGIDSLQICRAATNIYNTQPQTVDKGWSSSLGVEQEANKPSP
jgi:hypothetical protein